MNGTLGIQPWMSAPATRAVIAALEARGYPGCARFVGGAVRNTLMGRAVEDVDIATVLKPEVVMAALEAAGLRAAPTGLDHGTVTAIADHKPFEITTLRRDVATDGRRAVVAYTHDWAEDAQRRDFRFNALYADPDGTIFDPTGEGVADALAGRVVFVGDPMIRLREDYLRILRFFRFYAWYGEGAPDQQALSACRTLRGMLGLSSAERVQKELMRLLAAEDPRRAIAYMIDSGVMAEVLPQATGLDRLDRLVETDLDLAYVPDPELRLEALVAGPKAGVADLTKRLRLSKATQNRLTRAFADEPRVSLGMGRQAVHAAVWRAGLVAFRDKVRLAWAEPGAADDVGGWTALIATAETWMRPRMPVSGDDALAAGAPRGEATGRVLTAFEAWWIGEDFPTDRTMALAKLSALAQAVRGLSE